jgi:hypothetical protein
MTPGSDVLSSNRPRLERKGRSKSDSRRSIPHVFFPGLSGWEHLINAIRERAKATPGVTLVLDEFPHLCESNPGLPFVLQKICDEVSPEGIPFNLMLCGSRIISFFLKAEAQELYRGSSQVIAINLNSTLDRRSFGTSRSRKAPETSCRGGKRRSIHGGRPQRMESTPTCATPGTLTCGR